MIRRAFAGCALVLLLAGCATAGGETGVAAIRPSEGRSGLYLSGTIDGRQVAVTDGAPRLHVTDCDPQDGRDRDVCVGSRTIDGRGLRIVFENPGALESEARLPVRAPDCRPADCDDVTDHAIVGVQFTGEGLMHAHDGELVLRVVEPHGRYMGSLRLQLPDGRLSGDFNVVPRPEE